MQTGNRNASTAMSRLRAAFGRYILAPWMQAAERKKKKKKYAERIKWQGGKYVLAILQVDVLVYTFEDKRSALQLCLLFIALKQLCFVASCNSPPHCTAHTAVDHARVAFISLPLTYHKEKLILVILVISTILQATCRHSLFLFSCICLAPVKVGGQEPPLSQHNKCQAFDET